MTDGVTKLREFGNDGFSNGASVGQEAIWLHRLKSFSNSFVHVRRRSNGGGVVKAFGFYVNRWLVM